jgi:HEAT repeat protein
MNRKLALVVGLVVASGIVEAQPAKRTPRKKEEIAQLAAQLSGADVEAASKAAAALGSATEPAAHDALLDALALGLPPAVAGDAIAALAPHAAPPDVLALRRYATHRKEAVRSAALAALAGYPDPQAHAAVVAGLHDPTASVRAAAATAAGKARVREAVDSLMALLAKGEDPAGKALAAMADPELARRIAEQLGSVPDTALAQCLGGILKRADFGPDPARVEIVRAIAKIQDQVAVTVLTDYVDSTPKNPIRPSRKEAETIVEARLGGGK